MVTLVLCFGLDFKSHRVCVCVCGGGGFYCTTEASSLIREAHPPLEYIIYSWDVRGNFSTKSKVTECVKRLYLCCAFELLGANLLGSGLRRSTIPIQVKLSCLRLIKIVLALMYTCTFILMSGQP